MIRINLLPGPRPKAVQQQRDARIEAVAAAGVMVLILAGSFYYSWALSSENVLLEQDKTDKEQQIKILKSKVKQVEKFKANQKLLQEKTQVIELLEKERVGPVLVLDHVSRSLDPLKIWLIRLSMKGRDVEVEGKALTTNDIVEFVNRLRRSDYFSAVRLIESRAVAEAQVGLFQFRVDLTIKG